MTGRKAENAASEGKKVWIQQKIFFLPRNPLKRLKTAKGIFGNVWRFQAESLEKLGVGLEMLGELRGAPLRL
jgi:hypothetical protein